jgi:hypothetical protein
MCLPVSRLFWVSSLAYPNLLGTKGYVVVVVVVVVAAAYLVLECGQKLSVNAWLSVHAHLFLYEVTCFSTSIDP